MLQMPDTPLPSHESRFRNLAACVLIPTYNNAQTLEAVIRSVAAYTHQIIVVNDGSTDGTGQILERFPFIHQISYTPNRGKGNALRQGFRYALQQHYRYAISIDSDGQHYAHDLPTFLEAIEQRPGCLIIGARNMDQAHIPGKSSFGNRFSNFWFWVETGIRLPDTQSGYRLYPLAPMRKMKFFTRKYEFEIETPVRIAWKGVPVISVPVSVYYPPAGERISHFRPFKDFTRISILNTFLTFTALLWIHPRNLVVKLTSRKGWAALWQQIVVRREESNQRKAASIAFGVFMGIFPVWGFQLAIGIPLAIYFRLNKALFLLAANISIFPFTPVFWALSVYTGKWLLGYHDLSFRWRDISLQQFKEAGIAFFLGGAVLAITLSIVTYLVSWLLLGLFRREQPAGDR
ncbi:DUF2062 domain-containing protein [Taibaiella koreensis]|uniref:DUF2062 domain-containing protein n=1 Tax=Taibaiella koreensis TaxID=1268548 RepID=UPI001F091812|nr:DUF2062 domain-containing protein [Taibaiella koreensis]